MTITLPTGTVTFLFTDIEGSTNILQRLGDDEYAKLLDDHNNLLRDAFAAGIEVSTEGDSFFYVFPSATDSVEAAIAGQLALSEHTWPEGGTVRVRMGLHSGDGKLGGDNYVGIEVNRAARIAATGNGGQILLSQSTKILGAGALSEDSVTDLGDHHFKGLEGAERVFQIGAPGLPVEYPPIRSLDSRPHNLPERPSVFVGRVQEASDVAALLDQSRLVTLTGPGGAGKSRLAIHVASRVIDRFEHGVTYVALDGLRSADQVMAAIAGAFAIPEGGSGSPTDQLIEHLTERSLLLLLDTFEHVLSAAADLSRLLTSSPLLHVLVTSQALLRIRGERAYPVPPLSHDEAIDLFTTKAAEVDPTFMLTDDQVGTVATLVDRLDASPLALELAAARMRLFGLNDLLARISDHLDFGGSEFVDGPERHRNLRSAIEWSYDLLDERDSQLFRELGIFEGGFILDAAEQVASVGSVTEGVASLLDKSLLQRSVDRGEVRFSILESIRHFALERLAEGGEDGALRRRHAGYYAELSEQVLPKLEVEGQDVWLDRLEAEHDNLRAAVRYSVDNQDPDPGLLVLGGAWRFFQRRGHMSEAVGALGELLKQPEASPHARAIGMNGLAALLYWQGKYEEALEWYLELLPLVQEMGDRQREAETLFGLSTTYTSVGDLDSGHRTAELATEAYAAIGSPIGAQRVLAAQAYATWMSGDLEEALAAWKKAEEYFVEIGDQGEIRQAHVAMAVVTHQLGRTEEAIESLRQTLNEMVENDDASGIVMVLGVIGAVVAASEPRESVVLMGATARLRDKLGGGLMPETVGLLKEGASALEALGEDEREKLQRQGEAMDLDEAVAYGLGRGLSK